MRITAQMVTAARVDGPTAEPRDLSFLLDGSCFHPIPDAHLAEVVGWFIRDGAYLLGQFDSRDQARRYVKTVHDAGATRIAGRGGDPGALTLDPESLEFEPATGGLGPNADVYR